MNHGYTRSCYGYQLYTCIDLRAVYASQHMFDKLRSLLPATTSRKETSLPTLMACFIRKLHCQSSPRRPKQSTIHYGGEMSPHIFTPHGTDSYQTDPIDLRSSLTAQLYLLVFRNDEQDSINC